MTDPTARKAPRLDFATLSNYVVIVAFAAIFVFFAIAAEGFIRPENLLNILVNNVVLLAIVALGMTIVISSGAIDLSVGVSVDMSSMVFIMLVAAGFWGPLAIAGGLFAAVIVGLINAILINKLRIDPFLATLGVLFIGESTQKLATRGGQPIYLTRPEYADTFNVIVRTNILGIPAPVVVLAVCAIVVFLMLHRSVFGRFVSALGAQSGVAWYSGVNVGRQLTRVFVGSAVLAGITGILLSATVRSYVPESGSAFLLDAIGATFIGTAISAERRPSVIGTILGVMLLAITKNGLLLIGWNFFWQQVGIGILVFLVLAFSFGVRRYTD